MVSGLFSNKVVLVTGSNRNLGAVIAETFARQGAAVIINGTHSPASQKLGVDLVTRLNAYGVRAEMIPADLTKSEEIEKLCQQALDHFGKVDVLINNAGPFNITPYLSLDESRWDLVMNVNVKAIYLLTHRLGPLMKKNGWGRIINLSADSADTRDQGVYSLAKAAVRILTEQLALELGPEVTINAVSPGQIQESLEEISTVDSKFIQRYKPRLLTSQLVTRQALADLIVEICGRMGDHLNGATIKIDGGTSIARF